MRIQASILILLACPGLAAAGEIYGKITLGGSPVGEGVEVSARCGATAYPATQTDKTGSYHLVVNETGKCTLTITRQGQSAALDVASYDDGAQADIVLESKDNQLTARRR